MKSFMIAVAITNIISATGSLLMSDYFMALIFSVVALAFAVAVAFDTQEA
jgi:hypothetical protein